MELYLDIETVANTNLPIDLMADLMDRVKPDGRRKDAEASVQEKRAELIGKFALAPMTAQIIGIGTLYDGNFTYHEGKEDEIVTHFVNSIQHMEANLRIVTFNGRSFDLPHIYLKMAKYDVLNHRFMSAATESRYERTRHYDVREVVTNYDPMGRGTLKQWAMFFGVDVPPDMHDGSEIQELWDNGQFEAIKFKNKQDLHMLKQIYEKLENVI